jgi:membrane-associated phospholipid phosphatase
MGASITLLVESDDVVVSCRTNVLPSAGVRDADRPKVWNVFELTMHVVAVQTGTVAALSPVRTVITRIHVRRTVAAFWATAIAFRWVLPAQAADSMRVARRPSVITWLDVATLGAGVAGSIALMPADSRIARRLESDRYQDNDRYQDLSNVAAKVNEKTLFAAGVVTYGIAKLVRAPRTTTDNAWHTTESIFIASATATLARGILGRSRPFVSSDSDAYAYKPGRGFRELSYRAYPSIHAAAGLATAAALTAETARHSRGAAWIVGPISYSLAGLPGLARMYEDKHWASDVLMGAALGAVSGWATVRYHHRPGNRFDRVFLGAPPTPTATPAGDVGLVWISVLGNCR